jgi:hypothetical protein
MLGPATPLAQGLRDQRGSVGVIFGLLIVPIMALAGAGFDYAQAARIRAKIQDAADSAVLAAAQKPPGPSAEVEGERFFMAQARERMHGLELPQTKITDARTDVRLHFGAGVPTSFLGLIGHRTIAIEVRAKAVRQPNLARNPCVQAKQNGERLIGDRGPNGRIQNVRACRVDQRAAQQGLNPLRDCRAIDIAACEGGTWDVRLAE